MVRAKLEHREHANLCFHLASFELLPFNVWYFIIFLNWKV